MPVKRVVKRGRDAVTRRVYEAAKTRVNRVRELCDKAGESGTVPVSELRKIVGGGG